MSEERYTIPLTITFTEDDYSFFKEFAGELGVPITDLVRHLVYEGISAGEEPEDLKDEKEEPLRKLVQE